MQLSDLAGHPVLVLGAGREGRAACEVLREIAREVWITDENPAALAGLPPGAEPLLPPHALGRLDTPGLHAVVSPGIPPHSPLMASLAEHGVPVTSGTDLFLAAHGEQVVAVTGTKGKSTVAHLLSALLRACGVEVRLLGNVGTPALEASQLDPAVLVVLECSSQQAALVSTPPRWCVLTSLFPEHLDWHGSVEAYYGAKLRLVEISAPHRVVAPEGDDTLRSLLPASVHWSPGTLLQRRPWLEEVLVDARLRGAHNRVNTLLALTSLEAVLADREGDIEDHREDIRRTVAAFEPLPHRLETISWARGIEWVDDTLATAPEPTVASLRSYPARSLSLIAGGLDRGLDLHVLVDHLLARPEIRVYCVSATGARLHELLTARGRASVWCEDLPTAVARSAEGTPVGGVVLLSPAAASYGEYPSYAEKAAHYRSLVSAMDGWDSVAAPRAQ